MTTGLQMAIASGALVGTGVALLITRLRPAQVDLADALARLTPTRLPATPVVDTSVDSTEERLGAWATRVLPPMVWTKTPMHDLALLGISVTRFYGEKVAFAAIGLVTPPLLALLADMLGAGTVPIAMPLAGTLILGGVLFFLPNYNAMDNAKKVRRESTRPLGAYVDLVALERHNGAGTRQAMENAAAIGNSWIFVRIKRELARSRWSGTPPWRVLDDMADDLALPQLSDVAHIMRLSGEEGASVYSSLRARATSLRTAMLTDEITYANAASERMSIPGALLGLIFMAILLAPVLLRMFAPT